MQLLAAHRGAVLCLRAVRRLDAASPEASRLRRDAVLQQRVGTTLQRALDRARARPLLADAATGEVRPAVPVAEPRAAGARRPAAAAEPEEAPPPFPPPDVFAGKPDLQRLHERWHSLPRWEDMSVEERRETWGYKPEPSGAADAGVEAER